jgi:hypothetical protein
MEGKKSGRGKSQGKQKEEQVDTSSKNQEFVEKMKKRATVKTHGIDNVSRIISLIIKSFARHQHLSIQLVLQLQQSNSTRPV